MRRMLKVMKLLGAHAAHNASAKLYPQIAALFESGYGRSTARSIGFCKDWGSSPFWTGSIERRNAVVKLALTLQNDCHLPTDASTFFLHGVADLVGVSLDRTASITRRATCLSY